MICTARLQLQPCELPQLAALLSSEAELESLLNVTIAPGWTEFPEAIKPTYEMLQTDPSLLNWWAYWFIHVADRSLIGWGGFKGKPNAEQTVEIGYEITSAYRNQGLATEAAQGLIDYAFSQASVQTIEARTLPQANASTHILEKVGMKYVETIVDPDDGELWLWRLTRAL